MATLDLFKGRKAVLETKPLETIASSKQSIQNDQSNSLTINQTIKTKSFSQSQLQSIRSAYQTIEQTCHEIQNMINQSVPSMIKEFAIYQSNSNSLYEIKFNQLVEYFFRIGQVLMEKCQGMKLSNQHSIDELIKLRVVFDRMKAVESKMKYSIDKLIQQSINQTINQSNQAVHAPSKADPLSFAPNPNSLLESSNGSAELDDDDYSNKYSIHGSINQTEIESKYVPPRLNPVDFAANENASLKRAEQAERLRERAHSSSFVRSMMQEASDRPEERRAEGSGVGELDEEDRVEAERTRFEEENMIRLIETKAYKKDKRKREQSKALNDFDDFDDLKQFLQSSDKRQKRGGSSEDNFPGNFPAGKRSSRGAPMNRGATHPVHGTPSGGERGGKRGGGRGGKRGGGGRGGRGGRGRGGR